MADDASSALATDAVEIQLLVRRMFGGLGGGLGDAVPELAVAQMSAIVRQVYLPEGSTIYRQDEPSAHIFFISEGFVRLSEPDAKPWTLGPHSVFGIIDAQLDRPHARTATAVEDVSALVVNTGDWLDLMEENFELTQLTILRNASRLWEEALQLSPSGGFPEPGALPSIAASALPAGTGDSELSPFQQLLSLRLAPLFERAGVQALIRLARATEPRLLEPNETLFEQGDAADSLFVVVSGLIEARRDEPLIEASFGPTSVVGGYASLCQQQRPFTTRAASRSVVIELPRDDLHDVMEDHFDMVLSVQAYLSVERERIQRLRAPSDSRQ